MTDSERLRAARLLVMDPFAGYPEATERERKVAALVMQGWSVPAAAKSLRMGTKTAYRDLTSLAAKVTAQERHWVGWDGLARLAWRRLAETLEASDA